MNLNHLLYFQTLAHLEHYGRAAQKLHITQPSLSKAIQNLEEELKVRLFERDGRGIRLTREGAIYLNSVENAIYELKQGRDLLRYECIPPERYLRLGMIRPLSISPFPDLIKEFQLRQRSSIFYSCVNAESDELAQKLKQQKVDLILCEYLDEPSIELTKLWDTPLTLLVPMGHPFYERKDVDIQELNGESFLTHSRDSFAHKILAGIYLKNDILVHLVGEADDDISLMGMVSAGLGLAVLTYAPSFFIKDVKAIPILGSGYQGGFWAGHLKAAPLPALAQSFFEYLTSAP